MVVTTPNAAVLSLERNQNPFHVRHFQAGELCRLMEDSGFDLLELRSQDVYLLSNGRVVDTFSDDRFEIREDVGGQFLIAVFRKSSTRQR
jgi:hypothetical protein